MYQMSQVELANSQGLGSQAGLVNGEASRWNKKGMFGNCGEL